jgi:SAM-dependent methyltransferase
MTCCCSNIGAAVDRQFSEKRAAKDLAQYRAKGPASTTRLLLAGLAQAGAEHGTLLDVGSGVGTLTFELISRGIASAVGIDLSSAYVATAANEASRRGQLTSTRFVQGNFVDLASELPSADIVTLDRVICCYPDCGGLLDESLGHADRYVALSYPRDLLYVRAWVTFQNVMRQMLRDPFRTFVHSAEAMENRIRRAGFVLVNRSYTLTWCADVYTRG